MLQTMDAIIELDSNPTSWAQEPILACYGAMKLGHHPTINEYARLISRGVVNVAHTATSAREMLVASSPRGTVPSASNLLAVAVVNACREYGSNFSLGLLEIGRRRRGGEFPRHYASLDTESRVEYLRRDRDNWFVHADLRGRVVILVDDVNVTGSQQGQLAAFLQELDVHHLHFQYLVRLSPAADNHASTIETELNLVGVANDDAFVEFLRCGNFTITTRLLWRLIELPDDSFHDAISALEASQLAAIVAGIRSEGTPSATQRARLQLISSTIDQLEAKQ